MEVLLRCGPQFRRNGQQSFGFQAALDVVGRGEGLMKWFTAGR